MLVSRLDYAAQAVYADAEPRFYDDIGCLATDREAVTAGEHRFYVHTPDGRWTEAGAAHFAIGTGARTPMAYDVVAIVPGEGRGEEPLSATLTWAEIVKALEARQ